MEYISSVATRHTRKASEKNNSKHNTISKLKIVKEVGSNMTPQLCEKFASSSNEEMKKKTRDIKF